MNTDTPASWAPPTDAPMQVSQPQTQPQQSGRLSHPVALWLAVVGLATTLAVVIGMIVGIGGAAISADSCSPNDGWCGLGALLIGAAIGLVAGATVYVATTIALIRRFRARGERAAHIAAALTIPPAALTVLGALTELAS